MEIGKAGVRYAMSPPEVPAIGCRRTADLNGQRRAIARSAASDQAETRAQAPPAPSRPEETEACAPDPDRLRPPSVVPATARALRPIGLVLDAPAAVVKSARRLSTCHPYRTPCLRSMS